MLTIPEPKDVIQGELAARGDWVVANIATHMYWPVKAQRVDFCGVDVWITPLMKDSYPALAINRPSSLSREDCERLLMRFLSTLCWVESRADEAFADLLKKHKQPVGLKAALKESVGDRQKPRGAKR